ncbi:MAG: hypothetical protein U0I48_01195 [Acutalibacteraceae bacterium]|nr:hypothetical protein [Acutalibacteraceae bacterium]
MFNLNLRLFDGEGAAAGAPAPESSTGEKGTASAAGKPRANRNPLADVVYGRQEPEEHQDAAGEKEAETQASTDRKAEFESLIKGDFKDEFDKRVQKIVKSRFKETRGLQEQLDKAQPVLNMLLSKYGAKDLDGLTKAIEEDNSFYEDEAFKRGMTVAQLKEVKRIEQENQRIKAELSQRAEEEQKQQKIAEWVKQGDELKALYPNFDLNAEFENKDFADLLLKGIDVKTAYQVMHQDEIMSGIAQNAVKEAQKATVESIKANTARPVENAAGHASSVVTKPDVHSLTKADRNEILRRVARGEKISF